MKKRLLISFLAVLAITLTFNFISKVIATTCDSHCSPPCDSSCTSCCRSLSNNFTVTQLPYPYSTPAGACKDSMSGVTIKQLPFWVDGVKYSSIPAKNIAHNYCVKESHSKSAACDYEFWWVEEDEK